MSETPAHHITIEYVPHLPEDQMTSRYNSSYHTDMSHLISSTYDGLDSWEPHVGPLMRQRPWASINISPSELSQILEWGNLAQFRDLKESEWLEDDNPCLSNLCARLDTAIDANNKRSTPIFARLRECSMKKNMRGAPVPYSSAASIITSIMEDNRVYLWLTSCKITETVLFLSDYDTTMDVRNEYRVFVCRGIVTGISPYRWYTPHVGASTLSPLAAYSLATRIVSFVKLVIDALPSAQPSIVADVVWNDDQEDTISLVEINKFGGQTGCGGALFHWKRDESVLYNDQPETTFRILLPSE
ncbi:hypothetical protein DFS34DRAFT_342892 [Phlyctochytrium arcticum]|nr:hypothetical protein DFS34DRAFT_342892 [Phlyctochytrium arcticum]